MKKWATALKGLDTILEFSRPETKITIVTFGEVTFRRFLTQNGDAGLALKDWHAPLPPCDTIPLGSLSANALASECWKRYAPKAVRGVVAFNKFDSVS